ncbi:MAG: hypothetical protein H6719_01375 [Sandaracinaceae bacterium]|nr:hypothetical protein [Sandaracinaceae bacterium]
MLHTRVPAVLEDELKRLAKNLRVPVSNVVRAILEDAIDAVDTVGEVAEGELLGFADRLARQRDHLRDRVTRREPADDAEADTTSETETDEATEPSDACPEAMPELLDGVFGFQALVLATDAECGVCGKTLPAGSSASRALFDDPKKRVFLGSTCRLMPEKG